VSCRQNAIAPQAESEYEARGDPNADGKNAQKTDAEHPVDEFGARSAIEVPPVERVRHDGKDQARLRFRREREAEQEEGAELALP